ncbi:MAG: hypothetical protein SOX64_05810 [Treponema sp.]|nr:hypothetical protein [Treponema sp.]
MKKQRLIAVFAAMAFAALLAGCQQPSSGGDSTTDGSTDFSKAAVGDIVLKDETFVKPENFTDEMKDKAAAVIVRTKSGDTPALGVGIHHNRTGLAWCTSSAAGYKTNITGLQISNCTDGSKGWSILKAALGNNDDTADSSKYPAWEFCNTYGTKNNLTGSLATGWYLPALAELKTIYGNKTIVDASLLLVGGSQFGTSWYWSCCQSSSDDDGAYGLRFVNGNTDGYHKYYTDYVCSVRAFN